MSDNKKYYYLKLKDSFFNKEELKIIESQENGYIYSNLYLKMCLLSLKHAGKLIFREGIPYNPKLLSTVTGIPSDNVKEGIRVLKGYGLIEIVGSGTIYMNDIHELIGKGSSEGERKAAFRRRIEEAHGQLRDIVTPVSLPCPEKRPLELELEIEIEKDIEKEIEKEEKLYYSDEFITIGNAQAEAYKKAYPTLELINEFCRMRTWLLSNPTKRKTPKGYSRFINSWLSRSYESSRPAASSTDDDFRKYADQIESEKVKK